MTASRWSIHKPANVFITCFINPVLRKTYSQYCFRPVPTWPLKCSGVNALFVSG
jgi:hypothetical protein